MEGGLGIRSIISMNKALLPKQGWRVYHVDNKWSSIWKHKYLYCAPSISNFLSYPIISSSSTIWGVIQGSKHILNKGCKWKFGDGRKVRFWEDEWLLYHPLVEYFDDISPLERCK